MLSIDTARLTLNDGNKLPMLGLGVYQMPSQETQSACLSALKHGYRLIDTAALYKNEEEVGKAVRSSSVPRSDVFVTTKLWNSDHGKKETIEAFEQSLNKLGLDYVDLYLVHSPQGGKNLETWDAMVELKEKGLIKSIGVSNFNIHHLENLKSARPNHIPAVNQIELSPYLDRDELVSYCKKEGIVVQAYSPLTQGKMLKDPPLVEIAQKYKKSTAQVLIRWSLQQGFSVLPKSSTDQRIAENGNVFDFEISESDMSVLNALKINDVRVAWNPLVTPWQP